MPTKPRVTAADAALGRRLRALRKAAGVAPERVALALGVSGQQLNKYEIGQNRVAASRLPALADVLGVSISAFFGEG